MLCEIGILSVCAHCIIVLSRTSEKKITKFSPFLREYFENINFIEMPVILNLGGFDIL